MINLEYTIKTLDKAIDIDIKKQKTMIQLKRIFVRLSRATKKEFWLNEELKSEIIKAKIELVKEKKDPSLAVIRAKKILMQNEKQMIGLKENDREPWNYGSSIVMGWNDFEHYLKFQYKNDREKLIKEGSLFGVKAEKLEVDT